MWKEAERLSKQALEKAGVKYEIEEGGAAHYGPKADIYIKSIVGKAYAIGTDQLDLYMPGRFKLTYTDRDGKEKTPYIIHRAPLGSHERMIGFLLEHFAGAFPLWLAPVQVEVIPVSDKFAEYGAKVHDALREAGVRVEMSDANETLGKRIRAAELMKIPYILVVGEKEAANGSVNVRHYKLGQVGEVKLEKIVEKLAQEIREKTL
jgi:threonyl-tRNA synthetase